MSQRNPLDLIKDLLRDIKAEYKTIKPNRVKILVEPKLLRVAASRLLEAGFNHLNTVSTVDYIKEGVIEVSYVVGSVNENLQDVVVFLSTRVPRDNPEVESLTNVWPAAELHEREQWEMMGVTFKGNKNLRPLLLEDWHDIPPHRKDYVLKKWPEEERSRHGLKIPRA